MRRIYAVTLVLSLAALACASLPLPGGTGAPGEIETAVAATLTSLAPGATPTTNDEATAAAPSETPSAAAPTDTPAAPPSATVPAAAACSVVYADGANLFCLDAGGTPQVLASAPAGQQIMDPGISPDGQLVAYIVGVPGSPTELWVVGADAALNPPHILVASSNVPSPDPANLWFPRSFQWRPGTHSLFFDTGWQPVAGVQGPGDYINNDLWSADADAGTVALLLGEGLGGNFAVSPDGTFVAFSYATGLGLVNADGSNLRRDVVTYPSIITYSEYQFKPRIYWHADGLAFSVNVPSADPLAADTHATVYRVGTDGVVQTLATVAGNFVFGGLNRAVFSPDGRFMAYSLLQPGSSQTEDIHLLDLSTTPPADNIVDVRDVPSFWGWSPNGDHFAYASTPGGVPGSGYLYGLDGPIAPWAPGLSQIIDLAWQDAATFYFIGQINSAGWSLYRLTLGAEPVLVASGLSQQAALDARPAP
jgi:hypothetical protein